MKPEQPGAQEREALCGAIDYFRDGVRFGVDVPRDDINAALEAYAQARIRPYREALMALGPYTQHALLRCQERPGCWCGLGAALSAATALLSQPENPK